MAYEYETEASMKTLLRSALDDVRELFREEVALARAELRAEVSKATAAGGRFGAAAAAISCAGLFLLTALALGIATIFQWPAWTGFAIVGVVLAIAGLIMFMSGRRALREIRGLPRTVVTVKETFQ
jgi:Putative Actinobacterial Holin-X, holin superfamily III